MTCRETGEGALVCMGKSSVAGNIDRPRIVQVNK